ncbi:LysR family transcriptional regulator [Mangrovihabitans endophyticus]|uniref:LysR family transcriptional regulator n=1 Tax=Mangrovihabitans endophyticus TaxID=1751298 RepID=A0A8J3BYE6_9ACTN|nr:LysR substrate-binding domain-containing protein [Mangrovihabitans endophyticus]GGK88629.1 LysR family transcriptional regulator [Mangrovihabitans endophyticus]
MELRLLRYFVAVADERHFGRAAARLHMTQPPLSRAIQQLEADLGVAVLHRSAAGVELTAAGAALYDEARALLEQAGHARARVTAASGATALTIGTLADSAGAVGTRLAASFRERHPAVRVTVREADFTDPTTGLRSGLVDVALTRAPFDAAGIGMRVLRSDPMGAVLRSDDPLAARGVLCLADLADRSWFRLPESVDPVWRSYWSGGAEHRPGPVVRTVHECMQAVLWTDTVGLAPAYHAMPPGLTVVPLTDMPPSRLVVAWPDGTTSPLVRSFVSAAAAAWSPGAHPAEGGRAG